MGIIIYLSTILIELILKRCEKMYKRQYKDIKYKYQHKI